MLLSRKAVILCDGLRDKYATIDFSLDGSGTRDNTSILYGLLESKDVRRMCRAIEKFVAARLIARLRTFQSPRPHVCLSEEVLPALSHSGNSVSIAWPQPICVPIDRLPA